MVNFFYICVASW